MSVFCRDRKEIRTTPCKLTVREAQGGPRHEMARHATREDGNGRSDGNGDASVIEGVAIVFGPEYRVTDCWGDTYVEKIAPEAVTEEWLKTQDVKLNLLHKRDMTIARCNMGEGNLEEWVEKDGVHFRFETPDCDLGKRAEELTRLGVYSGCSFEFYPKDYTVEDIKDEDGKTVTVVTHTAFERLDALTIAMDPAYEETSVSVREMREAIKANGGGALRRTAVLENAAKADAHRGRESGTEPRHEMARHATADGSVKADARRGREPGTEPRHEMARHATAEAVEKEAAAQQRRTEREEAERERMERMRMMNANAWL